MRYPIAVRKRDGTLEEFSLDEIEKTIEAGVRDVGGTDFELAKEIAKKASGKLGEKSRIIETRKIPNFLHHYLMDGQYDGKSYDATAWGIQIRANRKERSRGNVGVLGTQRGSKSSTDSFLMVVDSTSKETLTDWNRGRIVASLINEGAVDLPTAKSVAEEVETQIFSSETPHITTHLIRELAHTELIKRGKIEFANNYRNFGIPRADLEDIVMSKIKENSNVNSNNSEAIGFGLSGRILKAWALSAVFSPEIAEAHSNGAIHLHDLDMPTRVYCSAHSLEYVKKYGLDLPTSNSASGPAKHSEVLIGHLNTFLATMQANYAGALGVGDINVLFSPLLRKDLEEEGMKRIEALKEKLKKDERKLKRPRKKQGSSLLESIIKEDRKYIAHLEADPIRALSEETIGDYLDQSAESLIFNGSQNAFSRGGQTLFLDFNIHAGVPNHLKKTPIILDGKYQLITKEGKLIALEEKKLKEKTRGGYHLMELIDPRDKSIVLKESVKMVGKKEHLEQKVSPKEGEEIATYGCDRYNSIARRFTRSMLKMFGKGDHRGSPFAFPKCDFHINEEAINGEDKELSDIVDFACEISSKNGATYFVFDRDAVTMSACCRLRTTIDDDYILKHPETMRFCGFQNVTINLPQAAYRAAKKEDKTLEGFLKEVDWAMDLAVQAHLQKQEKIKEFQKPGGPQYFTGKTAEDGVPYIKLKDATYIIGLVGLNDACKFLIGKELHEMDAEEYKKYGLGTLAHMNVRARELSEANNNLKFSVEESPAESATKRLASMDLIKFPEEAKQYVRGDVKNGVVYYTNSNHLAPNAPVDLITRIRKQGLFHPAIDSGAITHAFVGEERPDKKVIRKLIETTYKDTQTAQLTISPEFTVCETCDTTHAGLKEKCPECESTEVYGLSRIVGYYSKIPNWIDSKRGELEERHSGDYSLVKSGQTVLQIPELKGSQEQKGLVFHRFGKPECPACKSLGKKVDELVDDYKKQGVSSKHVYHDVYTDRGMTNFMVSRLNPSRVPGLIVMNNGERIFEKETNWGVEKGKKFISGTDIKESINPYLKKITTPTTE